MKKRGCQGHRVHVSEIGQNYSSSKHVGPSRLTSELLWDLQPKGSLNFFAALSWWAGSSVSGGNICVGPTDTHVYTYRITMYSLCAVSPNWST